MNGSAIPITRVLSSKIVDDGPLTLAEATITTLSATTAKADHIQEKTTNHGVVTPASGNLALMPSIATNGSKVLAVNAGATALEFIVPPTPFVTASRSDDLVASSDDEVSTSLAASTLRKQIALPQNHNKGGQYRVKYKIKVVPSGGRTDFIVRANGVVNLNSSANMGSDTYTEYTANITMPFGGGGTIELWQSTVSSVEGYVKDFRIYCVETPTAPAW